MGNIISQRWREGVRRRFRVDGRCGWINSRRLVSREEETLKRRRGARSRAKGTRGERERDDGRVELETDDEVCIPCAQLLEASELVKQIEEVFGVDASAPAGGVVMAAGPAAAAEAAEEKTEFDLVIDDVAADKRIAIIKVVRGLTDLGLKEAKDAVTNVPFTILAGKKKEEVEAAKKQLEEGGAKCTIK